MNRYLQLLNNKLPTLELLDGRFYDGQVFRRWHGGERATLTLNQGVWRIDNQRISLGGLKRNWWPG